MIVFLDREINTEDGNKTDAPQVNYFEVRHLEVHVDALRQTGMEDGARNFIPNDPAGETSFCFPA